MNSEPRWKFGHKICIKSKIYFKVKFALEWSFWSSIKLSNNKPSTYVAKSLAKLGSLEVKN